MKRTYWRLVLSAIVFSAGLAAYAFAGPEDARVSVVRSSDRVSAASVPGEIQTKGRYKRQGDECQWDANDTGPNQCTPVTEGRFKQDGDRCYWDAGDRGPNQCTPKKGRFKKEGDKCVWNADDSGPNQCNPRQPRS
jgi:hypothetical protein